MVDTGGGVNSGCQSMKKGSVSFLVSKHRTEVYFRSKREKEEWSPFLQFHTDPNCDCLFSAAREDRVKIS